MKQMVLKSLFVMGIMALSMCESANTVLPSLSSEQLRTIKKIDCRIDHGNITITASKKPDHSDTYCRYQAYSTLPKETVKMYVDDQELKIRFDKKALKKKTKKGKDYIAQNNNARVDFELCVPPQVEVEIRGGRSDVLIDGVSQKDIALKIGSGKVSLQNIKSDVKIEMGNIDALYIGYDKYSPEQDMLKCSLKVGNIKQGVIRIPSEYCVKNKIRATPYATKITNSFVKCLKEPNIVIKGGIGSGALKITQ